MGRPESAVSAQGPVAELACRLRARREQAGSPGYRLMAERGFYSRTTLCEAARGRLLPSWEVTRAYLIACGAADPEIVRWQEFWAETERAVRNLARKADSLATSTPLVAADRDGLSGGTAGSRRSSARRAPTTGLVRDEHTAPRPEEVSTFPDLLLQLRLLRVQAGWPPVREMATACGWSVGLVSQIFSGRRHPTSAVFNDLVTALLTRGEPSKQVPATVRNGWKNAWVRAEANRRRFDLDPRTVSGPVVLTEHHQDRGPVGAMVEAMPIEAAARVLVAMDDDKAVAAILSEMDSERAGRLLAATYELTRRGRPMPVTPLTVHQGGG